MVPRPFGIGLPLLLAYGAVPPLYNAGPLGMQPPTWPFTAQPQPWFPVPPIVLVQHQPLFPIQNAANLLAATAALVIQPQFQVGAQGLSSSGPLSVSPPLFPIGHTSTIQNLASTLPVSSSPTIFKGQAETNISAEGGCTVPSNQDELN